MVRRVAAAAVLLAGLVVPSGVAAQSPPATPAPAPTLAPDQQKLADKLNRSADQFPTARAIAIAIIVLGAAVTAVVLWRRD